LQEEFASHFLHISTYLVGPFPMSLGYKYCLTFPFPGRTM
jgi:hypothetical protein